MSELDDSDVVLKDEGGFYFVFANTEKAKQFVTSLSLDAIGDRYAINRKDKRRFLAAAKQSHLSVFEF